MDLLTQGVLGAAVGQAVAQKPLGRKALFWGAVAGLLPDIDVIVSLTQGPIAGFVHHRGITHSLWFGPVAGFALGMSLWRFHRLRKTPEGAKDKLKWWCLVCILGLFTHPLLDVFTSYGTQLWAPFSDKRYALNAVAVIDLRYTIPLAIALLLGGAFALVRKPLWGQIASGIALLGTTGFLFYGLQLNEKAEAWAQATTPLKEARLISHPTLFQPYRRHILAIQRPALCAAEYDTRKGVLTPWTCIKEPEGTRLEKLLQTPEGQIFRWFTDNQYRAQEHQGQTETLLQLHDARYPAPDKLLEGLWGIAGRFRKDDLIESPSYFRQRPPMTWPLFLQLLTAAFGD